MVDRSHWQTIPLPSQGTCRVYFQVWVVAQMVKNLPAMGETWVRSLGQDPLAKAAKPCRDTLGSSASQFSILTLQKHVSPSISHEVMGLDAMIFIF